MTSVVSVDRIGEVTRITLNDAASLNSLSLAMIRELQQALAHSTASAVIIAAEGPVFCSGHNLKEITAHRRDNDNGHAYFEMLFAECTELMMAITEHPAAIIAEVGGLASAAGCQLVATCDLAVASETAGFCTPGVNIGLFCSTPMVAVSRAISHSHAKEMLFTGDIYPANEALRFGLVNRVVPVDKLRSTTVALAQKIACKSPEAIRIGKRAYAAQEALPVREAYAAMMRVMADNLQCEDAVEGIGAFIEKRSPQWRTS